MKKVIDYVAVIRKSIALRQKESGLIDLGILIIGILLAILIRIPLLNFKSSDFLWAIKGWYVTIRSMGFSAFSTDFTTYNPPYLYELYLIARFFPDVSTLYAIKIPSLIGDFICAYFVYRIVQLKYTSQTFPIFAVIIFLFTPTVVLNSAFWGQADILFTAPLVACLYFLMIRKNVLAILAFGIALAFKLQAIFLAPLLLGLFLRGQVSWKHFLFIPLILFLSIIPAWIAGRPFNQLLNIYLVQAKQYQMLEMTAPTVYTWLPDVGLTQRFFTPTGIIFTGMLTFLFAIAIYKSNAKLTVPLLLKLAMVSLLFVPFFLPRMHDRYFYPADVLSVIYAFYFPQYFFVPIVIILSSFFAYQPTLFLVEPVPFAILAVGMFGMLIIVAKDALAELFSSQADAQANRTQ